ncbi:MAG TPA: hypothetical protein VFE27_18140 [Acidobacteriaceae bacterium]|nr:hypothetical protein [Acidobacteriaceae bacterium]
MGPLLAIAVFGSLTLAQSATADAKPQQSAAVQSDSTTDNAAQDGLPALPPAPSGKATVIGGEIRSVDFVRDQITLAVFGGRPMKILFDARTELYRDGIKMAPGDLHPDERASVETVLDGTDIFAVSVRMLSHPPEGECQGQVLHFDPGTRELTISGGLSREPVKLLVPAGTPVLREQQGSASPRPGSSDLVAGALVSVKFESQHQGRGVASQIAILATPGSTFVFSGDVSFLDLHAGQLALVDPRTDKSYQIFFHPASIPLSRDLHQGEHITVTAQFDGARYTARAISR